jgi:hypothetical protein
VKNENIEEIIKNKNKNLVTEIQETIDVFIGYIFNFNAIQYRGLFMAIGENQFKSENFVFVLFDQLTIQFGLGSNKLDF